MIDLLIWFETGDPTFHATSQPQRQGLGMKDRGLFRNARHDLILGSIRFYQCYYCRDDTEGRVQAGSIYARKS
jgi:hypothetical protein